MNAVIIMGVAGSGKTTIGKMLAERLGWNFLEGDELHPPANRKKMEAGTPLTDEDRLPWLNAIVAEMQARGKRGECTVIACSALKRGYRKILRQGGEDVHFIHLAGTRDTIASRLETRSGHFFPVKLLDSQLETLETPVRAFSISIEKSPDEILKEIMGVLGAELKS